MSINSQSQHAIVQRCLCSLWTSCRASCLHLRRDISLTSVTPETSTEATENTDTGLGGAEDCLGEDQDRDVLECFREFQGEHYGGDSGMFQGEGIRMFPWDLRGNWNIL